MTERLHGLDYREATAEYANMGKATYQFVNNVHLGKWLCALLLE